MPRYKYTTKINNDIDFYKFLREKRNNLKNIVQFETQVMYNPTADDRVALTTDTHIWSYGDRYYKLAHQYYGDSKYWWVIAWYNGYPTEATIMIGNVIEIPIDLETTLETMRTY